MGGDMPKIKKIDFEQRLVTRAELGLLNKRVLFTCPRHYAGNLTLYLVERGARPVWMPTIAIYPVDDYTEFDQAIQSLSKYDWIGFTSMMGTQAFINRLKQLGLDASVIKQTKIAAFRPDADPLKQLDIKPDLVPGISYPSEMIKEMQSIGPKGGRVLVPVPVVHGVAEPFVIPEFISELECIGMEVHRIPVYQTLATDEGNQWAKAMLLDGEIDITLFTSSAEIFGLLRTLDGKPDAINRTTVAFMGDYTARTGRELGINVDILPEEYTMKGVVEAIDAHFS